MTSTPSQVALFGTSADPPTVGHQAIIEWFSQHYEQVAIWAVDNPFKQHQVSLCDRMAMLGLLIDEVAATNIQLTPEFSDLRTIHSVEKARQRWGEQTALTIAIGSDLVDQIPSWYRSEELLQSVSFVIVPRPGYQVQPGQVKQLTTKGARIAIADFNAPLASSSDFRSGHDPSKLAPAVANYIREAQLY
ncbi:MAG: nicotinate-nucleotide adenylyltransferase [Cyanobacteria bacterium P01_H01_bin.15]